jgi:hypothetical protein
MNDAAMTAMNDAATAIANGRLLWNQRESLPGSES